MRNLFNTNLDTLINIDVEKTVNSRKVAYLYDRFDKITMLFVNMALTSPVVLFLIVFPMMNEMQYSDNGNIIRFFVGCIVLAIMIIGYLNTGSYYAIAGFDRTSNEEIVTQFIRQNNWYIKRIYPDYLIVRDRRNSHHQTTIIFHHNLILIDHLRFGGFGTVLFTSGLIPPTQKLAIKGHIQTLKKQL